MIFITKDKYNLIGFSRLSTYEAYKNRNYISLPLDKIDIQGKVGLYLENIISEQLKNDARNKLLDLKKGKFIVKRTSLIKVEEKIGCDDIVRCHRFFSVNVKNISFLEKSSNRIWYAYFRHATFTCPISEKYIKEIKLRL